ncbi:hypothetical protein KVR01_013744 [Diaporthe batatas]|uniref:uncharacterized protein n=1 Tax=Diaporthe batatas TaxID=748121 RepID=UPI001D0386A6|nr:uncharacterized protein KVR01_013744 [Diaporthe batatas]KAG8156403.1 hypothetical protein KVR01_013744 [Diaporthe batatas]
MVVSTGLCTQGIDPLGTDLGQSGDCPSDVHVCEGRPSLWPDHVGSKAHSPVQDWKPTHRTEKTGIAAAVGGTHAQHGAYIHVKNEEEPQIERLSSLETATYPLSRGFADSQSTSDRHSRSRSLDRPNLRICQSWPGTQAPEIRSATVDRLCEDFHEMKVTEWQQTVADFSMEWKQYCFVRRRCGFLQDSLVKDATKHIWQPLSDFNYVLSVYSFLGGGSHRNLVPHLRPVYMAWRSPEQARLHERDDLGGEDDLPSEDAISNDHESRDNGSGAAANKYPLTRRQHLRVARICGDADRTLEHLRHCLAVFRACREGSTTTNTPAGRNVAVAAEHQQALINSARQFQSHSKTLISLLRDSRISLCEALGLDPDKVPAGNTASAPTMAVINFKQTADALAPSRDGTALPRSFRLERASLQTSRVAIKVLLFSNLLHGRLAKWILGWMMARSTEMATKARGAGDLKEEAKMRRLYNKLRKLHKRASQEFPEVKPKMTLLDSMTWEAVLNPREDMQLEIHGNISLPVETLINMLQAPCNRARISQPTPGKTDDPPSVPSITMASEDSSRAKQADNNRTINNLSPLKTS